METKIKKAILDIVKGRIDRANYGMCSKYFVCTSSLEICESNNIHITKKLEYKDTITMNGVVIGEIRYRYAAHKRNVQNACTENFIYRLNSNIFKVLL